MIHLNKPMFKTQNKVWWGGGKLMENYKFRAVPGRPMILSLIIISAKIAKFMREYFIWLKELCGRLICGICGLKDQRKENCRAAFSSACAAAHLTRRFYEPCGRYITAGQKVSASGGRGGIFNAEFFAGAAL